MYCYLLQAPNNVKYAELDNPNNNPNKPNNPNIADIVLLMLSTLLARSNRGILRVYDSHEYSTSTRTRST